MKKLFPSNKTITYSLIILPLFIIAIAIAYYLVIFLPDKERFRMETEKAKILSEENANKAKQEQLQKCLDEARDTYKRRWDGSVERLGRKDETLPSYISDSLKDRHAEDQELCVKKYK